MAAGDGWYEELLGRGGCRVGSEKGTSLDAVVEVARRVLDLAVGVGAVVAVQVGGVRRRRTEEVDGE